MAHNLLRKVRTQRPNTLVGLDHSNLYAEGLLLKHLYNVFAPEVPDLTGHVATGVLNGAATWDVLVDPGLALHFDQSNDYIDCGNNSYVDITSDTMSIRARVSLEGFGSDIMDFCGKGQPWETSTGYCLYRYSDNAIYFDVYTSGSVKQCTHATTINDGEFHWVEAVYDGSDIWIIVDGVAGTKVACTGNIVSASQNFQIGRRYSSANYFAGYMDTFELHSVALSSEACASLRENPHQLLEKEVFHFITPTATGENATGSLESELATISGTAKRGITGTGALASEQASIAGTASRVVTSSGSLVAELAAIAGTAAGTSAYADLVAADGAVLHYRLGEVSGTIAVDAIGSADGTYVNTPTLGVASLLDGDADTCVTLTRASEEAVDIPFGSSVYSLSNRTIEIVINSDHIDGLVREYIYRAGDNTNNQHAEAVYIDTDGTIVYQVRNSANDTWYYATSTTALVAGTTYHIVARMHSTNGMSIAVNGIVEGTDSNTTTRSITTDFHSLGVNALTGTAFGGELDEFALYNSALADADIGAHSTLALGFTIHLSTGTLAAELATLSGTAERDITSTGALASELAAISGTAEREAVSSGSLVSELADIDGTASAGISSSGNLISELANISGTAKREVNATGALVAELATIAGTAASGYASSGSLAAELAVIAGTATREITSSGSLVAELATISGTADTPTVVTIDGSATATITTSNGSLLLYGEGSEYWTLEDRVLTTY